MQWSSFKCSFTVAVPPTAPPGYQFSNAPVAAAFGGGVPAGAAFGGGGPAGAAFGGPVWVDASGGQVPPGAVQGGQDVSGEPMFVTRAQHEGAMIPGKLVPSHGCAYVPWGGKEHGKPQYQVYYYLKL